MKRGGQSGEKEVGGGENGRSFVIYIHVVGFCVDIVFREAI